MSSSPSSTADSPRYKAAVLILHTNMVQFHNEDPASRIRLPSQIYQGACIEVLTESLREILSIPKPVTTLLQQHPKFCNEMAYAILAFKSKEALEDMKHRVCRCRCVRRLNNSGPTSLWSFHKRERSHPSGTAANEEFQDFCNGVWIIMNIFLGQIKRSPILEIARHHPAFASSRSQREGHAGLYQMACELMTRPSMWLKACYLWFVFADNPLVIDFIGTARSCVALADFPAAQREVVVQFPDLPLRLMDLLQGCLDFQLSHPTAILLHTMTPDDLNRFTGIRALIGALDSLLSDDTSATIPGYRDPHTLHIFTSIHSLLQSFKAVDMTEEARDSMRLSLRLPTLVHLAKSLYQTTSLGEHSDLQGMYGFLSEQISENTALSGCKTLWNQVIFIKGTRRCMNPPCYRKSRDDNTDSSTELYTLVTVEEHRAQRKSESAYFRSLLRCAECQLYTYCSKECQRAAWKDEPHPHKAVCKLLGTLRAVWQWDNPEDPVHRLQAVVPELRVGSVEYFDAALLSLAESVGVTDVMVQEISRQFTSWAQKFVEPHANQHADQAENERNGGA